MEHEILILRIIIDQLNCYGPLSGPFRVEKAHRSWYAKNIMREKEKWIVVGLNRCSQLDVYFHDLCIAKNVCNVLNKVHGYSDDPFLKNLNESFSKDSNNKPTQALKKPVAPDTDKQSSKS